MADDKIDLQKWQEKNVRDWRNMTRAVVAIGVTAVGVVAGTFGLLVHNARRDEEAYAKKSRDTAAFRVSIEAMRQEHEKAFRPRIEMLEKQLAVERERQREAEKVAAELAFLRDYKPVFQNWKCTAEIEGLRAAPGDLAVFDYRGKGQVTYYFNGARQPAVKVPFLKAPSETRALAGRLGAFMDRNCTRHLRF